MNIIDPKKQRFRFLELLFIEIMFQQATIEIMSKHVTKKIMLKQNPSKDLKREGLPANCHGTRIIHEGLKDMLIVMEQGSSIMKEGLSTNTLHRSITSRLVGLPFVLF